MFDIYIDVAAYMTWIGTTIKKMGGMLACDLVIEETNPEGVCFNICICYDEYCGGTSIEQDLGA